jgi:hypothetical protein
VLSSPVFANPHFRSVPSPPLLPALDPRAGSYDTNYLGSPHPNRAFCGSRAETSSPEPPHRQAAERTRQSTLVLRIRDGFPARAETLVRGFTFNFKLSTLNLVTFRPSRGLCELCTKNSPPRHPGRAASLESALQNFANSSLQTASPRPPLHQIANSRPLFSTPCALFCNYGGGGGSVPVFVFPISSFVFRSSLSLLESALTSQHRVSPCFARTRPPATPLESALPEGASVSPLESASTKNMGEGKGALTISSRPAGGLPAAAGFCFFLSSCPLSPVLSYSYELFGHLKNSNSFVFLQFQTLSRKHPGWGYL